MADRGARFRNAVVRYIQSWGEDIEVLIEKPVGYRFVNIARKLDIVLRNGEKYLGIEAKLQETQGTAYQKLSYAIEDCLACPIPTIIVFAGKEIKLDMKTKLISSGIGIEVVFTPNEENFENDSIVDKDNLFRQRVCIELGLDWFKLFK